MQDLPIEVISNILGYLDFSSRREAALVCRTWYEASLHPILLKHTRFVFDATILEDEKYFDKGKHLCYGCMSKSPNVQILGLDENFNAKLFLRLHKNGMQILGPHVEHLSLKNSSILESTFIEILSHCENLKSLDLSGCNSLFMAGSHFLSKLAADSLPRQILSQITSLELSASRYMNDSIICQFFSLCPEVSELSLASNNLLCHSLGISKSNSLTFLVVQQMISVHARTITSLDFSRTSIMSEALEMLASTEGLKLKSLVIQYCKELSDGGVCDLVRKQRGLVELNISGSCDLGDATVCAVCDNLYDLHTFKLRKCPKVSDKSVRNLHKLKNLRHLDISECFDVGMSSLHKGISGLTMLKTLEMKGCNLTKFTDAFTLPDNAANSDPNSTQNVVATSVSVPRNIAAQSLLPLSLRHLEISSSQYVNDATVQAVSMYLVNLQVLRLSWCSSVTDFGLLGIVKKTFNGVNDLDEKIPIELLTLITSGKHSTNHSYSGLIQQPGSQFKQKRSSDKLQLHSDLLDAYMIERGIVRLTKLRELDLSNCRKVTLGGLRCVFGYKGGPFKLLESLNLNMMRHSVNDDLANIIVSGCPDILNLSLAFADISDVGVLQLTRYLRNIDTLDLSSCDGITDKSLDYVASNCKWLRELDLSMCRNVSAAGVQRLRDQLPAITRLQSRHSGGAGVSDMLKL